MNDIYIEAYNLFFLFIDYLNNLNFFLIFYSYGYSKERFVWSLISAVGIFCLGAGATIVHGVQNLWISHVSDA